MDYFGKIIDTHCHIYPEKIAAKAVKAIGDFYDIPMCENGTVETLIRKSAEIGTRVNVVHSLATSMAQVSKINDFIIDIVRSNIGLAGFATLHPDMTEDAMKAELDRVIGAGLKGLKLHPDFQQFKADGGAAMKIYRAVNKRIPVLFHAGDDRYDFSGPSRIARVAGLFPGMKIIAAHFGGYREWDKVNVYKGLDNIYFDTCSSLYFMKRGQAEKLIHEFGEDKFLFATDFPMWNPREELMRFAALDLSDGAKEKILFKNAQKLLNI